MHLNRLVFKNFMRIKQADLDLSDKDIIGILGRYVDNDKRSNFVGKSSVIEGIRYALTGKSRTSKATQLIHFGESVMETYLELVDDDGKIYPIRRGVTADGKSVLEVGWGDKKKEGQQIINDLLGIDEKDFELTFFFKQSEISQFMNLGSADKKKMIMKWQKNDHWVEKEKAVLEDVKRYKESIKEDEITLRNMRLNLDDEATMQDEYTSLRVRIKDLESKIENETNELESLNKNSIDEKTYLEAANRLRKLSEDRVKCEESLDDIKAKKDKMRVLKQSYSKEEFEALKLEEKELVESKTKDKIELQSLSNKINKIKSTGSGICPIIEEECDRIKVSQSDLNKMIKTANDLKEKIDSYDDKIEENKNKINKLDRIRMDLIKFKEAVEHEKNYIDKLKDIETQLKNLEPTIRNYDIEAEQELSRKKSNIKENQTLLDSYKSKFSVLKHRIDGFEQSRKEIEELTEKLNKKQEVLSDLQYVAFMFGKNGIPSLEIENAFQEIEDEINFNMAEFDKSINIEFKPDIELKSWEELCLSCGWKFPKGTKEHRCKACGTPRVKKKKDELQLNVVQNGNDMPFEMCSGGLQTLVSLSVRIALTMLLKRQNQTKLNVLFLDEIDSALDEANKESIKRMVSTILIKKLGFKQIFWISHDKSISNSVPNTILVKGYKNHSELEWV